MMDLTKIDKPFGELDDEMAVGLFIFARRGGKIQMKNRVVWVDILGRPSWGGDIIYRAAPEPVTPDSIDWSHVADGWNYMARDADGVAFLYDTKPRLEDGGWDFDGDDVKTSNFASYRRGTCDWRDSLVTRPGVEDAK